MQEQTQDDASLESYVDIRKPISLSSMHSNDDIYGFEEKSKTEIIQRLFLKLRRKINPTFRNCLSNINDKDVYYGDIVVYETKDYRVVGIMGDELIIKNSKRMIKVLSTDINIKIKDIDGANAFYVYDMLYNEVESGIFDDSTFFLAFVSVFDVDYVDLYKSLPAEKQLKVRQTLSR